MWQLELQEDEESLDSSLHPVNCAARVRDQELLVGLAEFGPLVRFSTKICQGCCLWGRGTCQAAQEVPIVASAEDQQG